MIIETIAVILAVIIIAWIINLSGIGDKKPKFDTISIRESMDLCNLPIITFINNGNKFNFVLDSGATESHISESARDKMIAESSGSNLDVQGFNGKEEMNKGIIVDLSYKDRVFSTELFISPGLDISFADVKKNFGVQLHGIIGNDFLKEYGYVLDFYDLVAYSKV